MNKRTAIILSLAGLVVITLLIVLGLYLTRSTYVEVPIYPGAQQLKIQEEDNGRTRIITFQVNEDPLGAYLTYLSTLSNAGWFRIAATEASASVAELS